MKVERSVWIAGIAALLACVLASLVHPPFPLAHDEFSYLLAGDTLAHGRLANPPDPAWEHLETMHVLQQPTYASKYPPAQGFVLAVGTWIAGRPIVGVWLSLALAAAAVAWMLDAWIARPWPLVGGLLVALHPRIAQAWGDTYWGGAVAMAGGALVYGALPRIVERCSAPRALLLGLGLGLLALSRPFEGLVASVPAALVLVRWVAGRGRPAWRRVIGSTLLPIGGALAATAACITLHDRAVTGDPLRLPYAEFRRQYEVVPLFLFQPLAKEPVYRHPLLRTFYVESVAADYHAERTLSGFIEGSVDRLERLEDFFGGRALVPLLLGLPLAWRKRGVRFALACFALFVPVLLLETFSNHHYAAPFVPLGVFLAVRALASLWSWRGGLLAVRVLLCALLALSAVEQSIAAHKAAVRRESYALSRRGALEERLVEQGGKHLVVVRYAEDHNPHLEWVFNRADVESAPVVWARAMDPECDRRLLERFADRRAWLFEPDWNPERLDPYPEREAK